MVHLTILKLHCVTRLSVPLLFFFFGSEEPLIETMETIGSLLCYGDGKGKGNSSVAPGALL